MYVLSYPSPCPWQERPERLCLSRHLAALGGKELGARSSPGVSIQPHGLGGGTRGAGSALPLWQCWQLLGRRPS